MILVVLRPLKVLIGIAALALALALIRADPTTIIFGRFAGECIGNCGTAYQVNGQMIARDTTSFWQYYNDLTQLSVQPQNTSTSDDGSNYNDLKLNIPLIMLIDPRSRFGCPDCHDQGGYFLKFSLLGVTRHFEVDKGHEPFYYINLTKDIEAKIQLADTKLKRADR